ncbi:MULTISPECIES: peptide deformylase [Muribaculum]|jgi:peptide deformylase|uniref:Peptide deformylase n=1 Tax=Muribaculum caecicola TaxID=3038144 RepID=A0AC61S7A9_9BACT|nr:MULTISPECIES: peptide deformylase [Muribaculum]THG54284.1 peptide deformylase [Muribaculum caecicola]
MKLPIYLYGHPVLRAVSKEVDPGYPELKKLLDDMWETMYYSEGVGLAAPQIGRNDRIVVIDADAVGDSFPECAGRKFTLINPEIEILGDQTVSRNEGCLSLPDLSESVPRVEHIRLKWVDENFEPHEEEISGFLARIVQHECDHLEGKLYIDHTSPIRRQLIRGKLNAIIDGRKHVDYPVRYAPKKRKS